MTQTERRNKSRVAALSLAALGVVYGDIGTSPLYAIKEVFGGSHHPIPITPDNVLGILSLILWSLVIVVSVKYVALIMRADNKGEGGIMALMALVVANPTLDPRKKSAMILLGLFGAALFYGDGVITPAISVLSAVEGLEVATPALKHYVIPITIGVLIALFVVQKHGTARVGVFFGPVTAAWFIVLAILGIRAIVEHPAVLGAVWPGHGVEFLGDNPRIGFFSLGAVFLAVTGTEALYADMGHFGPTPIRLAWFGLVLPSLLLNYFGQGALLLTNPEMIRNPFYLLAPDWALYPLVALATAATVIASQAVISGAYSMTQQAIQLGYSPRLEVQHTSSSEIGQIYLPGVNWTLLVAIIFLVLGFKSSTSLAAAYGIAVSGTMIITTLFAYLVARSEWKWGAAKAYAVFAILLAVDVAFLSANAIKIEDGGWFPLAFGAMVFTLLTTWKRGRDLVGRRLEAEAMPLTDFIAALDLLGAAVVARTAVFMTTRLDQVPHALLHNLKHNMVLHERVVLATVSVMPVPRVAESERVLVERISAQIHTVRIFFGFMDEPDVPAALALCAEQGLKLAPMETSYFLGRETPLPKMGSELAYWREKLFIAMFRNAGSAANYFKLPPNQVVELGSQVVL